MTKRRAILLIAGMFLLAALALWLNAPKQATQPEADAVTTEYDWALKISRTARTEMPIQELLNALIAENCPAQMVTHARTLHTSPKGEDAWETSSYGEVELISQNGANCAAGVPRHGGYGCQCGVCHPE